jgi:hypothetical protein
MRRYLGALVAVVSGVGLPVGSSASAVTSDQAFARYEALSYQWAYATARCYYGSAAACSRAVRLRRAEAQAWATYSAALDRETRAAFPPPGGRAPAARAERASTRVATPGRRHAPTAHAKEMSRRPPASLARPTSTDTRAATAPTWGATTGPRSGVGGGATGWPPRPTEGPASPRIRAAVDTVSSTAAGRRIKDGD